MGEIWRSGYKKRLRHPNLKIAYFSKKIADVSIKICKFLSVILFVLMILITCESFMTIGIGLVELWDFYDFTNFGHLSNFAWFWLINGPYLRNYKVPMHKIGQECGNWLVIQDHIRGSHLEEPFWSYSWLYTLFLLFFANISIFSIMSHRPYITRPNFCKTLQLSR